MAGKEPRKPYGPTVLAVAALATVAYLVTRREPETAVDIPPQAAGWHGAMELYRTLAMWAGKRALQAEQNYWEAVGR